MKCPKCGYLGFEHVDRCRNCGYDFALAPMSMTATASEAVTASPDSVPDGSAISTAC